MAASAHLAVIGDYSSDTQTQPIQDVSNLVKSWGVSDVVTVGDNNYPDGAASTIDQNIGQWYHQYIYPYTGSYGAGSPDGQNHFWPSLGNHDWNTGTDQPYIDYFTLPGNERYYTTQIGDVGLFIVDADPHEPDGTTSTSVQGQWLQQAMAASTATWKLVFFHQPAYSSGGQGSNTYMQWPFKQWGATAVFQGHDHDYERLTEGGLTYFVDGLGGESITDFATPISGSEVRYNGDYGAMEINANDSAITFQFITRTDLVVDSYTINNASAETTFIPPGATWKYLDNGSNQGTAWEQLGFDDSTWKSGPAELGYGDGDEATVVGYGPDPNNKYITTYFRDSFNVGDPTTVTGLNLSLVRDDGAVVYLNGTEVYRNNMPSGTINYLTLASTTIGGADESAWYSSNVDPSLLKVGTNVIAVEIHQSVADSSDISFNFELAATTTQSTQTTAPAAPSGLAVTPGAAKASLSWLDNANNETGFEIQRSTDGTNYTSVFTTGSDITSYIDSGLSPDQQYWYRVRAVNSIGNSDFSNVVSFVSPLLDVMITAGDTWKYLDDGSNQGTAWEVTGFNDSSWKTGQAKLGYGDPVNQTTDDGEPLNESEDDVTTIGYGPDPNNKYITYYFRKSFTVADPSTITALNMQIVRDDGAVVYLNGTEVFRTNMPDGAISYLTLAASTVGGDDEKAWYPATINPALLVAGTNVIAVEVHQSTPDSSDIGFDFQLSGTMGSSGTTTAPAAPTNLQAQAAPSAIDLSWLDNSNNETGFKIERSANGGAFTQVFLTAANATTYVDNNVSPGVTYTYRVRATNSIGDSGYSNTATQSISGTTTTTYLSDLTWTSATVGWGSIQKDKSINGNTLMLAGVTYAKGIGTHAVSNIVYQLNGAYTTFMSDVGVDDEVDSEGGNGEVIFSVLGDNGAVLYTSPTMTQTSATQHISISVVGVQTLTLVATNGVANSIDYDHADWAGALLISGPVPAAPNAPTLNTPNVLSATQITLTWADNSNNEAGFKIERSSDGTNFTQIATVAANVTTYADSGLQPNTKYYYRVRASGTSPQPDSGYSAVASATTQLPVLPAPWLDGDVGSPGIAGSAWASNSIYTVQGGGANISGSADALNFVYEQINGDTTIIAHVLSAQNTGTNAKVGIMIRESLAAGAREACVVITPANSVQFIRRSSTNGTSSSTANNNQASAKWLKLIRSGNTFTAYRSNDNKTWTQIGSATITMAAGAYVGLAVCSGASGTLNTATFDNVGNGVVASPPVSNPPAPLLFNSLTQTKSLASTIVK